MKPHPFLWEKAQQELGFDYSQCLMVGDRYWADMLGAKRLGMTTIKINQGEHSRETPDEAMHRGLQGAIQQLQEAPVALLREMKPDFVIDDLIELIAVVGKISSK
jgi:FMN phosphatase YigB (HAD superfamily)